jgi:hypothetical protein
VTLALREGKEDRARGYALEVYWQERLQCWQGKVKSPKGNVARLSAGVPEKVFRYGDVFQPFFIIGRIGFGRLDSS